MEQTDNMPISYPKLTAKLKSSLDNHMDRPKSLYSFEGIKRSVSSHLLHLKSSSLKGMETLANSVKTHHRSQSSLDRAPSPKRHEKSSSLDKLYVKNDWKVLTDTRVDNLLLFCKANLEHLKEVRRISKKSIPSSPNFDLFGMPPLSKNTIQNTENGNQVLFRPIHFYNGSPNKLAGKTLSVKRVSSKGGDKVLSPIRIDSFKSKSREHKSDDLLATRASKNNREPLHQRSPIKISSPLARSEGDLSPYGNSSNRAKSLKSYATSIILKNTALKSAFEKKTMRPSVVQIANNIDAFFPNLNQIELDIPSPFLENTVNTAEADLVPLSLTPTNPAVNERNSGNLRDFAAALKRNNIVDPSHQLHNKNEHQTISKRVTLRDIVVMGLKSYNSGDAANQLQTNNDSKHFTNSHDPVISSKQSSQRSSECSSFDSSSPIRSPGGLSISANKSPLLKTFAQAAIAKHLSTKPPRTKSRKFSMNPVISPVGFARVSVSTQPKLLVQMPETGSKTEMMKAELLRKAQGSKDTKCTNNEEMTWYCGDRIGIGAYGVVFVALNLNTWGLMAVKQVETANLTRISGEKNNSDVFNEMEILKSLEHPHIVKFLGFEQDAGLTNLFLEYVPGGSIASVLKRTGSFNERIVRGLTGQILCALVYLHEQGVIHRDIKADNVLITEQGFAKISDFGISKRNSFAPGISRNRSGSVYKQKRMSQKGTPNWMAPEVIKNQGYSAKADIWSLGCTIIEMATGAKPWKGFDLAMAIFSQLNQNKAPPLTSISSPQTVAFVERCFEIDPEMRFDAKSLLNDSYIPEDYYDIGFLDFCAKASINSYQETISEEDSYQSGSSYEEDDLYTP